MDNSFKALNDATRRQILRLLRDGDLTAGEIADQFSMTKPAISHHLDSLKRAELVLSRREGQYIYYSLNASVVGELMAWILELSKGKVHNAEKRLVTN